MVAPTPAAPRSLACSTEPNMTWSNLFGNVSSSLWFSFTMNGMRWQYLRDIAPRTPNVLATPLQPPSMASSTMFFGSKYFGFGANDAAAECSMPWSTGRIDT